MKTDPAAAVRDYIASLRVPAAPPVSRIVGRSRRVSRVRAWLVPVPAGLVVAAVLLLSSLRAGTGQAPQIADDGRPPALPTRFAGYSYFTGSVSQSPPGPAIAVYQQGWGVELADFPQGLVLGARGDVYRRVDLADSREDSQDQGDPAPMLLSPDGTQVAVGSHNGLGDLALLDLRTGRVRSVPAARGRAVRPLAWSRDERRIAAIELSKSASNQTFAGALVVFDLTDGTAKRWPEHQAISMAVFSPRGDELAVQGEGIYILDLDGRRVRTLTPPGQPYLTSEAAWSPDGGLIAAINREEPQNSGVYSLVFLDPTGRDQALPNPIRGVAHNAVVGWTAADRLLTRTDDQLVEVDIRSAQRRTLSEFNTSGGNYAMARIQFAADLLVGVQIRAADNPNRGPWPIWWQNALAIIILLTGLAVTMLTRRLMRRRHSRPRATRTPI